MVTRGELLMLGISSGVSGGLVGGMLLGLGLGLVVAGANIGFLLIVPAAPISGVVGWILARRLARQLPSSGP